MRDKKTQKMVQTAVLAAIIFLMSFTPLGYLRTAGLEISLLTIPVVIGTMVVGPNVGLVLGLLFGFTSFYQCFGMSAFGAILLNINPFYTFLVCVPTRALMGWTVGVLFQVMKRKDKTHSICYFAGGLLGALFNTLFFMAVFVACFWNTDYVRTMNQAMGNLNIVAFVLAFVGINGIFEMIFSCLAGGGVSKILARTINRQ